MGGIIVVALVVLWLAGVIQVPGIAIRDFILFRFRGHAVSLLELLIFLVMLWAIETLPSPMREIAVLVVILWLLSTLGIISVTGLPNLMIGALVVGLVLTYLARNNKKRSE